MLSIFINFPQLCYEGRLRHELFLWMAGYHEDSWRDLVTEVVITVPTFLWRSIFKIVSIQVQELSSLRFPEWPFVNRQKNLLCLNRLFFMPPQKKDCPMKFGTAVNTEGLIIEIPCSGNKCAWFFDNHCAILGIAKELCSNQKKRGPKGTAAD